MLLEIIFKGKFSDLNLNFLSQVLINAKNIRWNYPEKFTPKNEGFDEINKIIREHEYADFVVTTDNFKINEKIIPKVFINLTKDENNVELFIYFDLNDFNNVDEKIGMDDLNKWSRIFQCENNFDYYICQTDNAEKDEYYFDDKGKGPLYDRLNN